MQISTSVTHAVSIGGGQVHDAISPSDEVCKTLNTMCDPMKVLVESGGGSEPYTASKAGFFLNARSDGTADTLVATDYKDPQLVCYGLDRASFNQGQNAQYNFSVEEELAQTIVSKGPGGGNADVVNALCACDYKGISNQYVSDGKCIIQHLQKDSTPTS